MLLVDLGNTRIKWCRALDGRLIGPGASAVHGGGLEAVLQQWAGEARPAEVRIVSVAPAVLAQTLAAWVSHHWDRPVRFLRSGPTANGIVNGYKEPARLGADRWAAVLGAQARESGPAVVVDCGSATTLDAVDAACAHRGGLILPGLSLMRGALHRGTAGLPLAGEKSTALFARDTEAAISSGTLLGLATSVDGLAAAMAAEMGGARLWLTGGDAPKLVPYLRGAFEHVPDLVLEGLAVAESDWR